MVSQAASVLKACPGNQDPGVFLRQGWANRGTRNLPGSPPLQLATLTDTGSQGLEGRLMEKAAGNLLCNKTVHKRQMLIKGSASAGNRFLCPYVSLREAGTRPQGLCRGHAPQLKALKKLQFQGSPNPPHRYAPKSSPHQHSLSLGTWARPRGQGSEGKIKMRRKETACLSTLYSAPVIGALGKPVVLLCA